MRCEKRIITWTKKLKFPAEIPPLSKMSSSIINFDCEPCSLSFISKNLLDAHIKSSHDTVKAFQCEICHKGFTGKSGLSQHIILHTGERPFQCEECGRSFTFISALRRHMSIHSEDKPYGCEECNKRFKMREGLVQHMRSHTKPFQCDFCGKTFSERAGLKRHVLSHTGESGGKQFQCTICEKQFRRKSEFSAHIRQQDDKPGQCGSCSAVFCIPEDLARHELTHNSNKQFECDSCDKQFKTLQILETHKRAHTKPFKCYYARCGKSFSSKNRLDAHIEDHNDQNGPSGDATKNSLEERGIAKEGRTREFRERSSLNYKYEDSSDHEDEMIAPESIDSSSEHEDRAPETMKADPKPAIRPQPKTKFPTAEKPHQCEVCMESFSSPFILLLHGKSHDASIRKLLGVSREEDHTFKPTIHKESMQNLLFQLGRQMPGAKLNGKNYECIGQRESSRRNSQHLSRQIPPRQSLPMPGSRQALESLPPKLRAQRNTQSPARHSPQLLTRQDPQLLNRQAQAYQSRTARTIQIATRQSRQMADQPLALKQYPHFVWNEPRMMEIEMTYAPPSTFECDDCHKTFLHEKSLAVHKLLHSAVRPFPCRECGRSFSNQAYLDVHKKQHADELSGQSSVENAPLVNLPDMFAFMPQFGLEPRLEPELTHVPSSKDQKVNDQSQEPEEQSPQFSESKPHCVEIGRPRRTRQNVQVSAGPPSPLVFAGNTIKFEDKVPIVFKDNELTFECQGCSLKLPDADQYETHRRKFHRGVKPYQCGVCHRGYSNKKAMWMHMVSHSKEKPFVCELCNRGFSFMSALKRHRSIHSSLKPFKCTICDKAFKMREGLYQHKKFHTTGVNCTVKKNIPGSEDSDFEVKLFRCIPCDLSFTNKKQFMQHRESHDGDASDDEAEDQDLFMVALPAEPEIEVEDMDIDMAMSMAVDDVALL